MDSPLSDSDVRKWLPNCKILEYDWLEDYETIDDLLPNDTDYCIILYEREDHIGHWICVMKKNKKIEHFDSFGLKPDKALLWINKQKRKELNCFVPYLSQLYEKSAYKIVWNKHQYQSNDANTCGRWCILRILYFLARNDNGSANASETGFKKWINKWKQKGQTYDEFVQSVIH
jgi:hypothetical protein